MLDDQNAKAIDGDQRGQDLREPLPLDARQSRRRLVKQNDFWFERENHRELEGLLQAVAQEPRLFAQPLAETGGLHDRARSRREPEDRRRRQERQAFAPCPGDPQAIRHA